LTVNYPSDRPVATGAVSPHSSFVPRKIYLKKIAKQKLCPPKTYFALPNLATGLPSDNQNEIPHLANIAFHCRNAG